MSDEWSKVLMWFQMNHYHVVGGYRRIPHIAHRDSLQKSICGRDTIGQNANYWDSGLCKTCVRLIKNKYQKRKEVNAE